MPPDAPLWESRLLPRAKTCTSRIAHVVLTTHLRDHEPEAKAIGKKAEKP
jgi:hypothetical protein